MTRDVLEAEQERILFEKEWQTTLTVLWADLESKQFDHCQELLDHLSEMHARPERPPISNADVLRKIRLYVEIDHLKELHGRLTSAALQSEWAKRDRGRR